MGILGFLPGGKMFLCNAYKYLYSSSKKSYIDENFIHYSLLSRLIYFIILDII